MVKRLHIARLPMTQEVIKRVESLAKKDGVPTNLFSNLEAEANL